MTTPLIFGREPAAISFAITSIIALLSAFVFHLSPEGQGLINSFTTAIMTAVVAVMVHDGKLVTVIVGAVKAGIAVATSYGLQWDAIQQSTALTAVEVVLGLLLRPQLIAPVAANNVTRTKSDVNQILNSMKRTASILVAATLIFATSLSLTSCALNPSAGVGGNAATFWNSAATQAFLANLQTQATTFLNTWVQGHLGASPKAKSAQDAVFEQMKAANPNVPDAVLRGVVEESARKPRSN